MLVSFFSSSWKKLLSFQNHGHRALITSSLHAFLHLFTRVFFSEYLLNSLIHTALFEPMKNVCWNETDIPCPVEVIAPIRIDNELNK